jgi:thiol:disulfide interchange protein DsbA
MKRFTLLPQLVAALLLCLTAAGAAAQAVGRDYVVLKQPQPAESPGKIEVIEFFWYGCPHCHALQPTLSAWLKKKPADVEFRRVPAVFQDSWLPLTRLYYTLDAMGLADKLHHAVFAALHEQKVRLQDEKTITDWVVSKGVDRQKFTETFNSFAVQSRTKRAMDLTRNYDVPGTPAIIVNGRYLTAPSMTLKSENTIDYERFFKVLDQLIAMSRKNAVGK